MGAGGSTQNGARQAQPSGPAGKVPPSAMTAMKGKPAPPLPTQFAVTPVTSPNAHPSISRNGIGAVMDGAALSALTAGQRPQPPGPVAASIAHQEAAVAAAGAGAGAGSSSSSCYRWFVEDLERVGQWVPYNAESSQRLEDAFLEQRERCLVTLKRHAYTVDLQVMQQLPADDGGAAGAAGGRQRRVRRAKATVTTDTASTSPATAETVEIIEEVMIDPFGDDDDDDGSISNKNDTHNGNGYAAANKSTAGGGDTFPHLVAAAQPSTLPIYSLDVSPWGTQLSPEALAVGMRQDPASTSAGGGGADCGVHILCGGKDGRLVSWDAQSGRVACRYAVTASRPSFVLVARYSPSARFVVCGCDDFHARLFRVGAAAPVHLLRGHTHKVYGVSMTADEERVVTGSMDSHVRVWDVETGLCTRGERCHSSHIFSVLTSRHSPDFCLSAGNDAILCAHDLRQANSVVMRLQGHTATVWDVAIHPGEGGENVQLASAGMDSTVRLWDPRRPDAALHVLHHHTRPIHSLRYLPNGRGILSASKDAHMAMADTATGAVLWKAKAQVSSVFRVLYHPGMRQLFTSGVNGLVNTWEWPTGVAW